MTEHMTLFEGKCPQCAEREREIARLQDLARDILRYRRGEGSYNFASAGAQEREIAALEAWEALELRLEQALSPIAGDAR